MSQPRSIRPWSVGLFLLGATALSGCPGDAPPAGVDGGAGDDAPIAMGTDAPVAMGTDAPTTPPSDAGPAASFETPLDTWTYVEIPGGSCANGSPYGVAVNRTDRSDRVVVFMQGGGACYDQITCYLLGIASHITDTLSAANVVGEASGVADSFFPPRSSASPFAQATYVYLPYCTGDVHFGNNVASHGGRETHHVGARNVGGVIAALLAGWASTDRVWVTGASAGGYGAMVNWYRFRDAFPAARVDVLDDSGPPVDIEQGRWDSMMAAWGVTPPPGCPLCLDGVSEVIAFYQRTVTDDDRFALLQSTNDDTIRGYTGLSAAELETGVLAVAASFAPSSNFHTYVVDGAFHVLLSNPGRTSGGVVLSDWVDDFASDDPAWANAGP